MAELKRVHKIVSTTWRAAVAQIAEHQPVDDLQPKRRPDGSAREYLTPEQAADALSIHVQTLRGYVRTGKLPALRLAGERSIRIRRTDLEKVLEPMTSDS